MATYSLSGQTQKLPTCVYVYIYICIEIHVYIYICIEIHIIYIHRDTYRDTYGVISLYRVVGVISPSLGVSILFNEKPIGSLSDIPVLLTKST